METIKSLIKKIDRYVPLKETAISLLVCSIALILVEFIWDGSVAHLLNMNHLVVAVILLAYLIAVAVMIRYIRRYLRIRRRNLGGLRDRVLAEQAGRGDTARIVMKAVLLMLIILPIIMLTLIAIETIWEGSVSYHINLDALIISTVATEMIAIIAVMVLLYRSRLRTGSPAPPAPAPRTLAPVIRAERAAAGLSTPAAAAAPAETKAGDGKRPWAGRVARVAPMVLFLVLLLVLALQAIFDLTSLEGSRTGLAAAAGVIGAAAFWMNRAKMRVKTAVDKEGREEAERKKEFGNRFPRLNGIPVMKWIFRWIYKEGLIYVLGLIVIISLFAFIRAPYAEQEFIDKHIQKYAATVEAADNMLEHGNPFLIQRSYQSDPVTNPEGLYPSISNIPLLEWIIYVGAKIFPFMEMAALVRLIMTLLGILALILAYFLIKRVFSKKIALVFTALLFSNWIFNLVYFVTVYDSLLFIFLFLISTKLYDKDVSFKKYMLLGFLAGFIAGVKYSFLLFSAPLAAIVILFGMKKEWKEKFFALVLFYFAMLLVPLVNVSFAHWGITLGIKMLCIVILSVIFLFIRHSHLAALYSIFNKVQLRYYLTIGPVIAALAVYLIVFRMKMTSPEVTLTDTELLFNTNLYYQIYTWLQAFLPVGIVAILLSAIALIGYDMFVFKNGKTRKENVLLIGFTVTAFFYLIIASKSIFFHAYYLLFFVITLILLFTYVLARISQLFNWQAFVALVMIALTIFSTHQIAQTQRWLGDTKNDILTVAQYINENFDDNELVFINNGELSILSYYTDRPTFLYQVLTNANVVQEMNDLGFVGFTEKYSINHYVTYESIDVYTLGLLFYDGEKESISRTDLILARTKKKPLSELHDAEIISNLGETYALPYLNIEFQVGKYSIYNIGY